MEMGKEREGGMKPRVTLRDGATSVEIDRTIVRLRWMPTKHRPYRYHMTMNPDVDPLLQRHPLPVDGESS